MHITWMKFQWNFWYLNILTHRPNFNSCQVRLILNRDFTVTLAEYSRTKKKLWRPGRVSNPVSQRGSDLRFRNITCLILIVLRTNALMPLSNPQHLVFVLLVPMCLMWVPFFVVITDTTPNDAWLKNFHLLSLIRYDADEFGQIIWLLQLWDYFSV